MLALHTILHPTDFSEHSEYAFELACALARDYRARLIILHVCSPQPPGLGEAVAIPDLAVAHVAAAQEKLQQVPVPGVAVRAQHRLEEGDPAVTIVRVADESAASLIVMGTHGRTGLGRLLMGSVAESVMRGAPCPVMTVRTPLPQAEPVSAAAAGEPL